MIIKNGLVYTEQHTFEQKDIFIENGLFAKETSDSTVIDAQNLYVIPGLIDIHFHGCVGYDFCDGTTEAVKAMAEYEASEGVTAICPATMTLGDDSLTKIFECANQYESETGADLVGINMEGPYLSEAKKGAQNALYLHKPEIEHFRKMNHLSGNKIKLVSIAPEIEGAIDFIKEVKDEVTLSIAHTACDYDQANAAFLNGASHVTHLFNAMNPFNHRAPGVVGAAYDNHAMVELICDGIHIHPSMIRSAFGLFTEKQIILISDSMMATGLEDGDYSLGGQAVHVKGSLATLADGTIAGSATNLMNCMRKAIEFGIPAQHAIQCVTENPAKEIGIYEHYGSITEGKIGNAVLLDKDFNVISVILKGKKLR
ncbi:N-acetylglucosamine-6-phosphate deacetylase [Velocimicrobium porci]|uniref:N-acetylglucosamine-6-phosphate deacetylase n=1 Tax=Velocimicrobium porci TaxID=2606634 RepID=A0A6L5XZP3_9FIRM|nr:N-acetylglucosamine-6-phosphate deacetylase [Velocimicrobium porci]MSS63393.1 N-acetylglucosamine-6-phosphate deacetylase [Velocimicrobium porci]